MFSTILQPVSSGVDLAAAEAGGRPAGDPIKSARNRADSTWIVGGSGQKGAIETVARSYLAFLSERAGADSIEDWEPGPGVPEPTARYFRGLHRDDPARATRLARGVSSFPEIGGEFLGFRIAGELGRGAFGRVYLAHQGELSDRPVALKVSAEMPGESRTLARLQHTNIVPIYSAHSAPPLHAVCMPFFGSATLADVFDSLECSKTIPDSGKALVRTLDSKRSGLALGEASTQVGPASAPEAQEPRPEQAIRTQAAPPGEPPTIRRLVGLSFVEAILWLGARMADGLAHAHDRGIVHRDLKPANVLLTDDGEPMLLDFNLSVDLQGAGVADSASMGGTLPYMSPEHLDAFLGGTAPVDARSDLYSVGVILFELLTGRHPFPGYEGHTPGTLRRMIEDRRGPLPTIRPINPRVSPAVESIVHHLIEADPDRRYRSARDLAEDIERHLANLPLKHAPEPSIAERVGKWVRRHPRATSGTGIALMAGAAFLAMAAVFAVRAQRLERLEARATLAAFREDFDAVEFLLNTRTGDPRRRAEGIALAEKTLGLYRAQDDPRWKEEPAVRNLGDDDRARLIGDVGELAIVLSRALAVEAADRPAGAGRDDAARRAGLACDLAAACFDEPKAPRALWARRAEVARLLGRPDEAKADRARAEATPLRTARDRQLAAAELVAAGEFRKALAIAREATRDDPRSLPAWLILADCHAQLEESSEAIAAYGTCIALRPEFAHSWNNRGIVLARRDENDRAVADFDRAIALRPDWFEPRLNRGVAQVARGDAAAAVLDYSKALELGGPDAHVLMLRAEARSRAGDAEGARRDREEGLKREPITEQGWIARGIGRLGVDLPGALEDFRHALKINPRSLPALRNSVYVLCEQNRDAEALGLLDRIIALYPDHAPARSSRGVLKAIQGRRDEAIRDAKESAWLDTSPRNLYQIAGIYATTSRQVAEDRIEAFRLLSTALRGGFGFEELPEDRELDAIRDLPEFRDLLAAARAILGPAPAEKGR